jgi:hypothetical protein
VVAVASGGVVAAGCVVGVAASDPQAASINAIARIENSWNQRRFSVYTSFLLEIDATYLHE